MTAFLRFVALVNAAVWLGGGILFTLTIEPAFTTPAMQKLLGMAYPGVIYQMLAERYYSLQILCGLIALAHLLTERVAFGRSWHRVTLAALLTAFCLALAGGLLFEPKAEEAHRVRYARPGIHTAEQQAQAGQSLARWQHMRRAANYLVLLSLFPYFWRISTPPASGPRFMPASTFRS